MGQCTLDIETLLAKPGFWVVNNEMELIDEELRKKKNVAELGWLYVQARFLPKALTADPQPEAPPEEKPQIPGQP